LDGECIGAFVGVSSNNANISGSTSLLFDSSPHRFVTGKPGVLKPAMSVTAGGEIGTA